MPIYEYRCTRCGHELDALQKVSDEPLTICPKCNESALVKKISAAGFRLKGGGWYETDFKSGKKRNVAGDSTGSGSDGGGGSGDGGGKSSESGGSSSADKPASAKPASGTSGSGTSGKGTPGTGASSSEG